MWNKQNKTIIFVIAAVIAGGIFVWKVSDNNGQPQPATEVNVQKLSATEVSYNGIAGKNALAQLKASHKVGTKTYKGLGEFVTSIDGIKPSKTQYWAFYVNGKESAVGAGSYTTKAGDKIVWKLKDQ